jgi:DHA2 family multidrug resistance protein
VILFTIASLLCAIATNLPEMVAFRIVQGISGAFIIPIGQAVLLDINPPERTGRAMALFGMGIVVGPMVGPFFGGWLTDNFNWRWCFIINVPVGLICVAMIATFLPSQAVVKRRFDLFGFTLLALAVGGLQLMLDRGGHRDWFASWEIWIECGLAISAGWVFLIHMTTHKNPVFPPAMLKDRNFIAAIIVSFVSGMVILAGAALIPTLLQNLMGYSVMQAGETSTWRGLGVFIAMIGTARLGDRLDPRVAILLGLGLLSYSLYLMTGFSLEMDNWPIVVSSIIQGMGMGLCFVPMNILAFATLAPEYRTDAASVLTLVRNVGGSIGISTAITVMSRNIQVSHSDLASQVSAQDIPIGDPSMLSTLGDAGGGVLAMVDGEIQRQAAMIAYIDDFHLLMWLTIASLPVALLLRKPEKGAGEAPPMMLD